MCSSKKYKPSDNKLHVSLSEWVQQQTGEGEHASREVKTVLLLFLNNTVDDVSTYYIGQMCRLILIIIYIL